MAAPYRRGDLVAHFVLDNDHVLVRKGTVISCARVDDDRWSVMTDVGIESVDGHGEGNGIMPLDDELRAEFEHHPDGFTVAETLTDVSHEQRLQQTVDFEPKPLDQGLDGGGHAW